LGQDLETASCLRGGGGGVRASANDGREHPLPADLKRRNIAIVVLGNSAWRIVRMRFGRIAAAVNAAMPGSYAEVEMPFE